MTFRIIPVDVCYALQDDEVRGDRKRQRDEYSLEESEEDLPSESKKACGKYLIYMYVYTYSLIIVNACILYMFMWDFNKHCTYTCTMYMYSVLT